MILKVIAAALTGIGGHYLNKRWDKAILFLCLFIFYGIFCWFAVRMYLFSNMPTASITSDEMMQQYQNITLKVSLIYLSGIIILWAISIVSTIADARRASQVDIFKWTKSGRTAAFLTTLLSFLLLAYTSLASVSILRSYNVLPEEDSKKQTFSYPLHDFYEYLYFGGSPSDSDKLPEPPEGRGMLRGQFIYENKPAEAVTLHIVLNSKYKARNIITDSNGFFTVSLPVGDWKINSIQTESWPNKPDGEHFSLYYGGEEKLSGKSYNRYNRLQSDGYPISINENKNSSHITIFIRKDIELVWPDDNRVGVDATLSDAISWKPYPAAAKYCIEIKHLRREGTTTYYNPVTSIVLSNETSLPLSSLKHVKTTGKENYEYAAEIFAFSEDGTLIAGHTDTFRGGTFTLIDGYMLVEDSLQDFFDSNSGEDSEAFQKKMEQISLDRRRMEAVEILIDENMVSEAETLLNLVNSEFAQGKKEVLSGYILALKGNCPESKAMFDKALTINPAVCIPGNYRKICE